MEPCSDIFSNAWPSSLGSGAAECKPSSELLPIVQITATRACVAQLPESSCLDGSLPSQSGHCYQCTRQVPFDRSFTSPNNGTTLPRARGGMQHGVQGCSHVGALLGVPALFHTVSLICRATSIECLLQRFHRRGLCQGWRMLSASCRA